MYPQQVGAAVDHYPGLACARPGQHQEVMLFFRADQGLLFRVAQCINNLDKGFVAGGSAQDIFPARKEAADKLATFHGKVAQNQLQGLGDLFRTPAGILVHDVNLKNTLAVMTGKRFKITFCVAPFFRMHFDGHGLAEHGQSLLQGYDPLLVQKHQSPIHGCQGIGQFRVQDKVCA